MGSIFCDPLFGPIIWQHTSSSNASKNKLAKFLSAAPIAPALSCLYSNLKLKHCLLNIIAPSIFVLKLSPSPQQTALPTTRIGQTRENLLAWLVDSNAVSAQRYTIPPRGRRKSSTNITFRDMTSVGTYPLSVLQLAFMPPYQTLSLNSSMLSISPAWSWSIKKLCRITHVPIVVAPRMHFIGAALPTDSQTGRTQTRVFSYSYSCAVLRSLSCFHTNNHLPGKISISKEYIVRGYVIWDCNI